MGPERSRTLSAQGVDPVSDHRQHAFGEPVRFLDVRIARQDEVGEALGFVLADQRRDLVVAADERGAGSPTDEPDPRPQAGMDLERIRRPPWSSAIRR